MMQLRCSNPSASYDTRLGTVELLVPHVFRNMIYECAAWWKTIACEPQTVEVMTNGYYAKWTFEGTVQDEDFGARFGGVPVGKARKPCIGTADTYVLHPYLYDFAKLAAEGGSDLYRVSLTEGFEAQISREYDSREWSEHEECYVPCKRPLYGIFTI